MKTTFLVPAALLALLSACNHDPVRVEDDFGQSTRAMVENQIYDPNAVSKTAAPAGLDGVQGEAVLKKHREHVGNPDDVEQDVNVNVKN